jgi:hypothetical protein
MASDRKAKSGSACAAPHDKAAAAISAVSELYEAILQHIAPSNEFRSFVGASSGEVQWFLFTPGSNA